MRKSKLFCFFPAVCASLLAAAAPAKAREVVAFDAAYPMGTIVVDTSQRKLYYSLGDGQAIAYAVAVGKPGFQWFGTTFVQNKRENPGWSPTARMRRMGAPAYVPPGPRNPLGVRAIYLGWTEYRIHGTNAPGSIGSAASSGCIRMLNADVTDLFERVHIGAPVHVLRKLEPITN
ncbi:MAG: L,D-transpeptidase [Pseudomonadota bacterium]|nr:L,D-transpeptidase [Pseudomonadota bacterium]